MTTPTSRIQQITKKFRADLLAKEKHAEDALNYAHAQTLAAIQPKLQKLYEQIAQKMANGEAIPQSWIYERIRQENLQLMIQRNIDNYSMVALNETRMQQHLGIQLGLESGRQQVNAVISPELRAILHQYSLKHPRIGRIGATFGVPSTEAINSLIGATQKGSPLADLFSGWGKEAADKASQALVTGITMGENPRQVAPRVQQALGISRQRALIISRDQLVGSYRRAALETYRANDDVCEGWVWSCAMLPTSCFACIMMNGTQFSLEEELDDHVCGRCARVPLTKDWSSLLGDLGIDTSDLEDTRPSFQSGADWFHGQDEETQRNMLGSRYNGWKNGDFGLHEIVGRNEDADWGDSIKIKSVKELVK